MSDEDIEDVLRLRPPIDRFRSSRTLSVTDVASQAWCEMQTAFGLEHRRVRTAAMRAGARRHNELELELHKVHRINVVTAADVWAVRLLNVMFGLEELVQQGRTRELPVFGSLQSLRNLPRESPSDPLWAIGVIDLVEFGGTPPRPAIVDTKTRTVPSMPGFAQKRSSRLQVAIYKVLFDGLTSHDAVAWAPSMLAWHDVDPSTRQFSHDVADQLQRRDLQGCSLLEVMQVALQMFRALGPSGEELKVVYEHQSDRRLLGEDNWRFNKNHVVGDTSYFLEFWEGLRPPDVVLSGESWKCRMCQFREMCPHSPLEDMRQDTP
ncbi:unnamed protein product (mitochondrion) [Plasmodiophora brassicae]|uniref:PD-(D/E)XK endonuclease-like domain-containing protein n=1 Tax=Plasmodiophora brassicae TaxID=37360 RepID=A0A0G4IY23_PLABS|nr:hypothetical protein PBRA_007846 [Plasmodiophora brassicae]SPR00233.1 unnamed protein product [Plasmodiophora brassicae]